MLVFAGRRSDRQGSRSYMSATRDEVGVSLLLKRQAQVVEKDGIEREEAIVNDDSVKENKMTTPQI